MGKPPIGSELEKIRANNKSQRIKNRVSKMVQQIKDNNTKREDSLPKKINAKGSKSKKSKARQETASLMAAAE